MSRDDSYAVLACAHCQDYFLTPGDWRSLETVSCSLCGTTRPTGTYRQVAEHPERKGAAELRARQRARDAGHGPEYAGVDDYGVLADRLHEQDWSVVEPSESSPHSTEFYETAAETAFDRHRDAFNHVQDRPIFTDWYLEAAADCGVDHPGADLVDELVSEQVVPDLDADIPSLPATGGLTVIADTHISPAYSTTVDAETLAPTALQTTLFESDSDIVDALISSMQCLAADCPSTQDLVTYLCEQGVTALDGAYARLVAQAVSGLSAGDQTALWRLLAVTRVLGGQTELGRSSLDDIERGPIALLALADESPTVELRLDHSFFEAKSTRRRRFLRHLHRLIPGFEIRIVGSRLTLRQFLDSHSDQLPTSVSEDAHQRLRSRETASTITEQRAQVAVDALEELGLEHPAWDVLVSLSATQREMRSYNALYADEQFDVTDSALRRRLARLRESELIETLTRNGDTHARLTPVGHAALEKHPELSGVSDTLESCSSPSSADWSTDHTEQTESQDNSPPNPSVSDPRNSSNSTVYAHKPQETMGPLPPEPSENTLGSLTSSDSVVSTNFLSLYRHHATAAAASAGQFSLVNCSLGEEAVHRDHREGRFSYDSDRDELVVSIDYSPLMALTAVRLCAALLSDKALRMVLTPDRLAGQPDGMSLDGLALSNPYVLRDVVCLGWLRDVDATGNGLHSRLEQARRDLLAMTPDLREGDEINPEKASEILSKAHGLMGVALRLYDLLDIDVIREIQFPSGAPTDEQDCRALGKFLAVASSISGKYGGYSGYRVLHEDREEKREQLLSEPDIDATEPQGTLLGPWVLTGEDVGELEETLLESAADLELQEDEKHFAPFILEGDVVNGNRRAAVAEAVSRILSFKDGLRPNRQTNSVLAGLSGDVFAAAQAVASLGREAMAREMDMQDVRYGLSQLPWRRILPDLGGTVVSKVVAALIDAQERLSTSDLAELANCSTRSLGTEDNERVFSELEAMDVLEREDLGEGKATLWRLTLDFRVERHDEDHPVPRILVDRETTASGGEWHLSNAVCEVLTTAADEYGVEYSISFGGELALAAFAGPPPIDRELEPLMRHDPMIRPVVTLLADLLDQRERVGRRECPSIELGMDPAPSQTRLAAG